jgi:hypothetical protein
VLEREQLPRDPQLDEVRAKIAYERGDFAEGHMRLDQAGEPPPLASAVAIEGRVVDTANHPVASAIVVAWIGTLSGDPDRVYSAPRDIAGAIAKTATDGTFTLFAPTNAAVIAQAGDRRSLPQPAAARPTLQLLPTYAVAGTVEGNGPFWANVYARYTIGDNDWFVHRPLVRDGTFQLGGLPRGGSPQIGAIGYPGNVVTHRILGTSSKIAWPDGKTIDVIVRSPDASIGVVYVFRGKVSAKTRQEVELLSIRAADVAAAVIVPIGANNTEAGRPEYRVGDRHAVLPGVPDGEVSVCATVGENARCEPYVVKNPIDLVKVEL